MQPLELSQRIAHLLDHIKAVNIQTLDVSQLTDLTHYMIICTATSSRHLRGIAHHLIDTLKADNNIAPYRQEPQRNLQWTLIDYHEIIVHIMLKEVRQFYALEKLWLDTNLNRLLVEA